MPVGRCDAMLSASIDMESAVTSTRSEANAGLFDRSPRSPKRTNSTSAPDASTSATRRSNSAFGLRRESKTRPFEPRHRAPKRDQALGEKLHVGHRVVVVLRLPAEEERRTQRRAVWRQRPRLRQLRRVELRGPQRIGAMRMRPPALRGEEHGVEAVRRPFGEAEIDVLRLETPRDRDIGGGRARAGRDDQIDRRRSECRA